jgi:hypothetical protein
VLNLKKDQMNGFLWPYNSLKLRNKQNKTKQNKTKNNGSNFQKIKSQQKQTSLQLSQDLPVYANDLNTLEICATGNYVMVFHRATVVIEHVSSHFEC